MYLSVSLSGHSGIVINIGVVSLLFVWKRRERERLEELWPVGRHVELRRGERSVAPPQLGHYKCNISTYIAIGIVFVQCVLFAMHRNVMNVRNLTG